MAEKIIYNIQVNSEEAQADVNALSDSMNAATGRADALSSSQSRLGSTQGTLKSTTADTVTQTGNLTREYNKNTVATGKNLKEQFELIQQLNAVTRSGKNAAKTQETQAEIVNRLKNANEDSTEATNINTKAVVENGGAIAILDQLTGGLASQFKNGFEALK